ncbi:LytTR family DNA-binding domain-containing protein [Tissierella praeacuta]|uniref:LytR/AlgR family response regulator transcription factor n=1 Tax=Tissierella praeacuta TaxID=43131 RepID=UPI00333FE977
MLNIAICEDNLSFANSLKDIVSNKLFPLIIEYNILCFNSGEKLLEHYNTSLEKFDVIFFDIDLPGISGTETAKRIRSFDKNVLYIFITCLDDEIYKILDLGIFNFIRKQYFKTEINIVIKQLINNIDNCISKYPFPCRNETLYLMLYEIIYIEVYNRKIIVHTLNETFTSNYRTTKELPFNTESNNFFELYRGIIVNLNHISKFNKDNVIMSNDDKLYISCRNLSKFKKTFFSFKAMRGDRFDF